MKIFSIVGWSGSGKTLLITRLVGHFTAAGKRVIAVKSTHAGYALQPEGKDTARYLQAGAQEAYLLADGQMLRMTPLGSAGELLAEFRQRLGPADIVLLEGLTAADIPMIEVADPQHEKALKFAPEKLAAVINGSGDPCARPCFHPDEIAAISAFMEAYHE